MAEEEAKTKWCCGPSDCGERRYKWPEKTPDPQQWEWHERAAAVSPRMCIGSACMAWRWDVVPEEVGGGKNWDGHCGLAGKP